MADSAPKKQSGGLIGNWNKDVAEAEKRVLDRKLPSGWERRQNENGQDYFIDHINKQSHWYRPPVLPNGWKMEWDDSKKAYIFCDPVQKTRSYIPPPQPEEVKDMWYYSDQAEKYTRAFNSQMERALNSETAKKTNAWIAKQSKSFMGWANKKVQELNQPSQPAVAAQPAAPAGNPGMPQPYAPNQIPNQPPPPPPAYNQVEGSSTFAPYQQMPPGPGTLRVKVLSAHGLPNVNQGGVSSPFATVWCKLKSGQINKRTIAIPENLNPHFNTEFVFDITNSAEEGDLRFIIFDERSQSLKMGETNLSMQTDIMASAGTYVGYRSLTPSGSLLLDVRFTT